MNIVISNRENPQNKIHCGLQRVQKGPETKEFETCAPG